MTIRTLTLLACAAAIPLTLGFTTRNATSIPDGTDAPAQVAAPLPPAPEADLGTAPPKPTAHDLEEVGPADYRAKSSTGSAVRPPRCLPNQELELDANCTFEGKITFKDGKVCVKGTITCTEGRVRGTLEIDMCFELGLV